MSSADDPGSEPARRRRGSSARAHDDDSSWADVVGVRAWGQASSDVQSSVQGGRGGRGGRAAPEQDTQAVPSRRSRRRDGADGPDGADGGRPAPTVEPVQGAGYDVAPGIRYGLPPTAPPQVAPRAAVPFAPAPQAATSAAGAAAGDDFWFGPDTGSTPPVAAPGRPTGDLAPIRDTGPIRGSSAAPASPSRRASRRLAAAPAAETDVPFIPDGPPDPVDAPVAAIAAPSRPHQVTLPPPHLEQERPRAAVPPEFLPPARLEPRSEFRSEPRSEFRAEVRAEPALRLPRRAPGPRSAPSPGPTPGPRRCRAHRPRRRGSPARSVASSRPLRRAGSAVGSHPAPRGPAGPGAAPGGGGPRQRRAAGDRPACARGAAGPAALRLTGAPQAPNPFDGLGGGARIAAPAVGPSPVPLAVVSREPLGTRRDPAEDFPGPSAEHDVEPLHEVTEPSVLRRSRIRSRADIAEHVAAAGDLDDDPFPTGAGPRPWTGARDDDAGSTGGRGRDGRAHRDDPPFDPPSDATPKAGRNLPAAIGVGMVLAGSVLASLLFRKEAFVALVAIVAVVGVWELATAMREKDIAVPVPPLAVGAVGMLVSAFVAGPPGLMVAFVLTASGVVLYRVIEGFDGAVQDVTAGIFTAAYVPFLAGFAILMLSADDGPMRVIVYVVVVAANDIGGYTAGVFFGRHPMAPTVSPKKSWEGFAGSVVLCSVVGVAAVVLLLHGPWWAGLAVGAATAVSATLGDLSESLLKRDLGVKDMGNLLPGHGGIMDRLDSLLPTAPLTYVLLLLLVPPVSL